MRVVAGNVGAFHLEARDGGGRLGEPSPLDMAAGLRC